MKTLFVFVLALFVAAPMILPDAAEAKRFGRGMSLGKQYRSTPRTPPRQTQRAVPNRSQAATGAAGRTSGMGRWLGPLAGLAAGGLLASLFFGDAFEGLQIMDILLVAALIFGGLMLFKAMRRNRPAAAGTGAGAYGGSVAGGGGSVPDMMPPELGDPTRVEPAAGDDEAPAWFDAPGFLDGAKDHFIRLQTAWDQADFRDIRDYTTPELFAELERERNRLGEETQHTEVVTLDAELVGVQRDGDQVVASILFSGLIREEQNATADPFRELWHVQHAWESSAGDWLIAGIQQQEGHEDA
ncbi:Tim44 domain-containing protein [Candidatus Thiosymbion oneisti]|uniref:Tim44 domain-containing protein n=1 Tax=Candidatus Thiosymbion oneisti TaxID=589554 RepID=UPI00106221BD|nr:TIM44-like domain-containing protein [Candidatus Thiosymbion oneisti]